MYFAPSQWYLECVYNDVIVFLHLYRYEDYAISKASPRVRREQTMKAFKEDLKAKECKTRSIYWLEIPRDQQHKGHSISLDDCLSGRIDPRVRDKIHQLVNSGDSSFHIENKSESLQSELWIPEKNSRKVDFRKGRVQHQNFLFRLIKPSRKYTKLCI